MTGIPKDIEVVLWGRRGPTGPMGPAGGAENYARVVDVADSGAQYTSVVAAIAAVNSGLTVDKQALVRVFVKEVLEDFTVFDFIHVVCMGDTGVRIKGSATPGTDIVTLHASGSLRHCLIEPQVSKASAIRIITGTPPILDGRLLENVLCSDKAVASILTDGVRFEAIAGTSVFAFIDCGIDIKSGNALNTVVGSAGNIQLLNTSFTSDSGKVLLIDGATINYHGGGNVVTGTGSIEINVAGGWAPSGVQYDPSKIIGTGSMSMVAPIGQFFHQVVTKTVAYFMTPQDDKVLCDASGGAFTVTLPDPAILSQRPCTIKKIDFSGNTVTVNQFATETIDGVTSLLLTSPLDSITMISDGTNWWIL